MSKNKTIYEKLIEPSIKDARKRRGEEIKVIDFKFSKFKK